MARATTWNHFQHTKMVTKQNKLRQSTTDLSNMRMFLSLHLVISAIKARSNGIPSSVLELKQRKTQCLKNMHTLAKQVGTYTIHASACTGARRIRTTTWWLLLHINLQCFEWYSNKWDNTHKWLVAHLTRNGWGKHRGRYLLMNCTASNNFLSRSPVESRSILVKTIWKSQCIAA